MSRPSRRRRLGRSWLAGFVLGAVVALVRRRPVTPAVVPAGGPSGRSGGVTNDTRA